MKIVQHLPNIDKTSTRVLFSDAKCDKILSATVPRFYPLSSEATALQGTLISKLSETGGTNESLNACTG